jgi:hypothetical protein
MRMILIAAERGPPRRTWSATISQSTRAANANARLFAAARVGPFPHGLPDDRVRPF